MSKATAGNTPVWHLAWVRQASAFAGRPKVGTGAFEQGQQVYFWQLGNGKWMVFDGVKTYVILATEDAKEALKSCRDEQRQVRLAEDQEGLTQRFYQAVAAQGSPFICRPRY
jgi:hypothetical protein